MRSASFGYVFGALLWLLASVAQAIGFGSAANATQLGQALNFAASVRLESDESLGRECVSAEVHSGDSRLPPNAVRVSVEAGSIPGERLVRVTTSVQIEEPVVSVNLSVGCTSRLARKFVVFVDPPLQNFAQAPAGELAVPTTPQRIDSAVSPILAALPATRKEAPRVASTAQAPMREPRPAASSARVAVAKDRKTARAARPTARTSVAATGGPRLKLDAAPEIAAAALAGTTARLSDIQLAAATAALSASAVPSAAASAPPQSTADQQRIQALEESLATLRRQNDATERTLLDLQARLRQAETAPRANPPVWVYALVLLCLVFALGWLLSLRRRLAERDARWWAEPAAARPSALPPSAHADVDLGASEAIVAEPAVVEPVHRADAPAAPRPQAPSPPTLISPATHPPAPPERELSVEELIDLEQQAEFFIVLGQDDAAIELLARHVRSTGGTSPMPYLKLLEIHRRRGERTDYERVRERFNRRFNAHAPDWHADLQQGRSLEAYPAVIEQLQSLWPTPARAMEGLDSMLFRRTAAAETFDLPAYREILFLYSIARDLIEHADGPQLADVDLLLPLADEPSSPPIARLVATGGHAVAPAPAPLSSSIPLDLDLDSLLPEPDEEIDPFLETGFREVSRPVIGKPKRGLH